MRATLSFTLPDECDDFDAAIQGQEAMSVIDQIYSHCRSVVKHCDPDEEELRLAGEIMGIINDSDLRRE